jgi:ApbE superfamily uncharacterized protein (UPF0280 family)
MADATGAYEGLLDTTGLVTFEVTVKDEHLWVAATKDMTGRAEDLLAQALWEIEQFAASHPRFVDSWSPYDIPEGASGLIAEMAHAAGLARVGPMASRHGAIAEYVAHGLATQGAAEAFVRYGSDLYLVGWTDRLVPLLAGASSLSDAVGLRIPQGLLPLAVCASHGAAMRDGETCSADAAVVLARSGAMADAVATAMSNRVCSEEDIQRALDATRAVPGVLGLLVALGGHVGAWGNVHLTALEP